MGVLEKARQMEAMRLCLSRPEEVLGDKVQAERADSEGKDGDEEKADVDVAHLLNAFLNQYSAPSRQEVVQ